MTTIYVSSGYCTDIYPENNGGEFYNDLNQNFYIGEGRRVGLAEIFYTPNSWDNVRDGSNTFELEMSNYPIKTKMLMRIRVAQYQRLGGSFSRELHPRVYPPHEMDWRVDELHLNEPQPRGRPARGEVLNIVVKEGLENRYTAYSTDIKYEGAFFFPYDFNHYLTAADDQQKDIDVIKEKLWLHRGGAAENIFLIPVYAFGEHNIGKKIVKKYSMEAKRYTDVEDFRKELEYGIRAGLHNMIRNVNSRTLLIYMVNELKYFEVSLEQLNVVKFSITEIFLMLTNLRIRFHRYLAYQLGLQQHMTIIPEWISWIPLKEKSHYFTRGSLDFNRGTVMSLYVFLDIIESNIVGSEQRPLMRIVPIDHLSKGVTSFPYVTYSNVRPGRINKIKIWITEYVYSKPLKFGGDVILKLIFE